MKAFSFMIIKRRNECISWVILSTLVCITLIPNTRDQMKERWLLIRETFTLCFHCKCAYSCFLFSCSADNVSEWEAIAPLVERSWVEALEEDFLKKFSRRNSSAALEKVSKVLKEFEECGRKITDFYEFASRLAEIEQASINLTSEGLREYSES